MSNFLGTAPPPATPLHPQNLRTSPGADKTLRETFRRLRHLRPSPATKPSRKEPAKCRGARSGRPHSATKNPRQNRLAKNTPNRVPSHGATNRKVCRKTIRRKSRGATTSCLTRSRPKEVPGQPPPQQRVAERRCCPPCTDKTIPQGSLRTTHKQPSRKEPAKCRGARSGRPHSATKTAATKTAATKNPRQNLRDKKPIENRLLR